MSQPWHPGHVAGQAHYPGDVREGLNVVMGPTTFGTFVVPTRAAYDPETDVTTVEFRFVVPNT